MDTQFNASYKAIIGLVELVTTNLKEMIVLNDALTAQIKTLNTTFQDDGYSVISSYIQFCQDKLDDAAPDLGIIIERLIDYAIALRESERKTAQ